MINIHDKAHTIACNIHISNEARQEVRDLYEAGYQTLYDFSQDAIIVVNQLDLPAITLCDTLVEH